MKGSFGSEVSVTLNDTFPPPPAAAPPLAIFLPFLFCCRCFSSLLGFGRGLRRRRDLTALYIRPAYVGRVLRNLDATLRNVRWSGRTLSLPRILFSGLRLSMAHPVYGPMLFRLRVRCVGILIRVLKKNLKVDCDFVF